MHGQKHDFANNTLLFYKKKKNIDIHESELFESFTLIITKYQFSEVTIDQKSVNIHFTMLAIDDTRERQEKF
jgi:hypothetical protein